MSLSGGQIGRYRILEELGSGGMSVVYKGLDTTLEREVAVKVLHPHLSNKQESRKRLLREAKAVAKLHHPNILEVFDFSAEDAQDAFLVTELIRGRTLRAFLDTEKLDPPEIAAMVVHQIASALAHAHARAVIHRDLKPENVMVREDGVLKLMDFGIAKLLDRDDRMTQTGALVGSPAHMAPEVIEGEAATAASDVFSLGTMLYLFTTGKLPFVGPNTTATLKRILDGTYEDPRAHAPAVSDELTAILAKAMARDPATRYPDADAFRAALEALLAPLGLERVDEELSGFFVDPPGYRAHLIARLVERLCARAESLVHEGRSAKALSVLNQLLALDQEHARARALLERLDRRRRRFERMRNAAGAVLAVAVLGGAGVGLSYALRSRRHRPARPIPARTQTPTAPSAATRTHGSTAVAAPSPQHLPASPATPRPATAAPSARHAPAPGTTPRLATATPDTEAVASERTETHTRPEPNEAVRAHDHAKASRERRKHATKNESAARSTEVARADLPDRKPKNEVVSVPVQILVRPYGFIRVDGGPKSKQALARHTLSLRPGEHEISVVCAYCQTSTETITVQPKGSNVFHIPAVLEPASLRFKVQPSDTEVTIGQVERTAGASMLHPFVIRSPKGPPSFEHVVTYTLTHPGDAPVTKTIRIPAGQSEVIQAKLSPR